MFSGPSNLKYKKQHKLKINFHKVENKFFCSKFGDYALQARSSGKLTAKQLESGRRVIRRFSKKLGFLKINIYPYSSVSKKPSAARMGKGKGKHHN
jgi:large subunit ribosomal protein L16